MKTLFESKFGADPLDFRKLQFAKALISLKLKFGQFGFNLDLIRSLTFSHSLDPFRKSSGQVVVTCCCDLMPHNAVRCLSDGTTLGNAVFGKFLCPAPNSFPLLGARSANIAADDRRKCRAFRFSLVQRYWVSERALEKLPKLRQGTGVDHIGGLEPAAAPAK